MYKGDRYIPKSIAEDRFALPHIRHMVEHNSCHFDTFGTFVRIPEAN